MNENSRATRKILPEDGTCKTCGKNNRNIDAICISDSCERRYMSIVEHAAVSGERSPEAAAMLRGMTVDIETPIRPPDEEKKEAGSRGKSKASAPTSKAGARAQA